MWDDIVYEFLVQNKLAKALDEASAGDTVPHPTPIQQILANR
jgi:hypothetical protein